MAGLQVASKAGPVVTLPGDNVTAHVCAAGNRLKLGTGLVQRGEQVVRKHDYIIGICSTTCIGSCLL
jgi:hypothetical protein